METKDLLDIAKELRENMGKMLSEMEKLRKENHSLKEDLAKSELELKSFQNNGKSANIVHGIDPKGEDAELIRMRIDENIQEIDKVIAQLSNK